MPSAPEFLDRGRVKRRIEIFCDLQTDHFAQTDRHIAIAAEIKVQLRQIPDRQKQCRNAVQHRNIAVSIVDRLCQRIRQQHFFGETEHEKLDSFREPLCMKPAPFRLL